MQWGCLDKMGRMTFAALLVLASGCVIQPTSDSETHWAKLECQQDQDCPGELSCLCNHCTLRCDATSQCDGLSPEAVCAPSGMAASCDEGRGASPNSGVCTMGCVIDEDCDGWGAAHSCVDGTCVAPSPDLSEHGASPIIDVEQVIPGIPTTDLPTDPNNPRPTDPVEDPRDPIQGPDNPPKDKTPHEPMRGVCDPDPAFELERVESGYGSWTLAIDAASERFEERLLAAPANTLATWHLGGSEQVFVAALSRATMRTRAMESARDAVAGLRDLGTVRRHVTRGEYVPASGRVSALTSAVLELPAPMTASELRERWLAQLLPSHNVDIERLPSLSSQRWQVRASATHIGGEVVYLLALQPDNFHANRESAIEDAIAPVSILERLDSSPLVQCDALVGVQGTLAVDTQWLIGVDTLDTRGQSDLERLLVGAAAYWNLAEALDLPLRSIVSTAQPGLEGFSGGLGWFEGRGTQAAEFNALRHGERVALSPDPLAALVENSRLLRGDAQDAMLHTRSGVRLQNILIVDREAPSFTGEACGVQQVVSGSCAHSLKQRELLERQWLSALSANERLIVVGGDGVTCGEENTASYKHLAASTGGMIASRCDADMAGVFEEIVRAGARAESAFVLPSRPIPASLKVYKDGEPVPRSRVDGYEYDGIYQTIVFHGSWRDRPGMTIQVRYEER